ncbi:CheF family chemotaxis protein [Halorarum halobium]|uniref:CheF family chemotaxis protein n=1 Tax=Halorarum halobium TaxID=3075121 RepID=UPI0028A5F160|nr:CheF family chemotaxis protein [Halobaculum sp. XH14]
MSESVVADFVGHFFAAGVRGEPPTGRIVLSQRRLVLAADEVKETIPLSSVFDVKVGQVPAEMEGYFNDTITIAYRVDDERRVAAVEGSDTNIDRFGTVLFKVLLNGTTALVRHPARLGGRVTDADAEKASLKLEHGSLTFKRKSGPFTVDLGTVISVERADRDLGNGPHPVVTFRHIEDGTAATSEVGIDSARKTNLLGRYIRLRYADVQEELADVSLDEEELEVLVALYSAGEGVSLSAVVDIDPQPLTLLLNGLAEKGIVVDTETGTKLTAKGRVVVGQRLESVNT